MSESFEKAVEEVHVGLPEDEAHIGDYQTGECQERLDQTIRKAQAKAWGEGWYAGAGWPQDDPNPYAEEADHE